MVDKNFTESQNPQHKNNVKHNYNTHSSLQVTQSQNAKKKQTQNPPHKHKTRKRTAENTKYIAQPRSLTQSAQD